MSNANPFYTPQELERQLRAFTQFAEARELVSVRQAQLRLLESLHQYVLLLRVDNAVSGEPLTADDVLRSVLQRIAQLEEALK